ncbi:MAG TPA: sulfurtransferase, partial [Planctomycetaceae bacterium]|nr:sulfurtransferase [Planctomycetaceae bacterium]
MAENISPRELLNRFQNNDSMRIIDVRTPAEFSTLHVRNVENIPLDRLETASLASSPGKDGFLYFICQSGGRSKKACDAMSAAGFNNVVNIEGGTVACEVA